MPMDGLMLGALTRELDLTLKDGRIDRVIQPDKDEVHLLIRSKGQNYRLLFSTSANSARLHLTADAQKGPMEPPMFCMLLRKYLGGGKVLGFRQISGDRIIEMEVSTLNDLGDPVTRTLVLEVMGRHSNLILLNPQRYIIDSIRRVSESVSRVRRIEPGLPYLPPPVQKKLDPFTSSSQDLEAALSAYDGPFMEALLQNVAGFSPQSAQEAAVRIGLSPDVSIRDLPLADVCQRLQVFIHSLPDLSPCTVILTDDGRPKDLFAFPQAHLPESPVRSYSSPSEAAEAFYRDRSLRERLSQHISGISHVLKNNIERCRKKIGIQEDALANSAKMETYKKYGELLHANLYQLPRGQAQAEVIDYYDSECPLISIPLDPAMSPAQNAQRYFKLYQKARGARTLAGIQKEKTEQELLWLEQMEDDLRKCASTEEVSELHEMMIKAGYMRRRESRVKPRKEAPSSPMKYLSCDGIEIEVGKNALQNERLTLSASGNETWLHAQKMPGSHVIVHAASVPESTLAEAAMLAAYYSKGVHSASVPVDVTLRRYIKKPGGTPSGFVIYTHQRTLYITPDEPSVRKIKLLNP